MLYPIELQVSKSMIQQQTLLKVVDNSGAKSVKCIKILGKSKNRVGHIGEFVIVSVQQLRKSNKASSKILKGDTYKALILQTKQKFLEKNRGYVSHTANSVCLLDKQNNPIATRILIPLTRHFLHKKYNKISAISLGLL